MFPAFPLRKGCISLILLCLAPTIYLIIALGGTNYSNGPDNFSPRRMIQLESIAPAYSPPLPNESAATHTGRRVSFLQIIEDPSKKVSMEGNDVIVVLHIQKTAGTSFEKFLVRHLATSHPCDCTTGKKRCLCRRPGSKREVWLFSRYSTGWICGLHADFTELFVSDCVTRMLNKKEEVQRHRRLFGTTFLRDPVTRVISEFRHVNRGATWMASRHMCQGRTPTSEELPPCFDPEEGWEGVTLDEFLNCSDNLAFNRQTRMLADLTLVGCYSKAMDPKMRDAVLLASAKENLRNLAFFGLKERMADSQYMFYMLFGLRFRKRLDAWTKSKSNDTQVSEEQLRRIKQLNNLDIQLYEYAATLFDQRIRMLRQRYPDNESLVVFNSHADNETVSFSRRDLNTKHRGSEDVDDNKIDDAEEDENYYDSDNDSDVAFDRERRGI